MAEEPRSVTQILDNLASLGSHEKEVSVGEVVKSFGGRSYGPLLLVPALIGMTPVGGIPGVPSFFALVIALFAVQILIARSHFWLPELIASRAVSGDKLKAACQKLQGPAQWLDRVFHGRLEWAVRSPFSQIAAVAILLLCVLIVPLELLPFAAALPFSAIAAFGLAMMARDGALMLLAIAVSGVSAWFALNAWLN